MSAQDGCRVYRSSSRGTRARALRDVYPVCRRLVGDNCFDAMAADCVRHYPSRHADLNQFGSAFVDLTEELTRRSAAFSELPWLPDLVRLEWLCHTLYYRDEDPPLHLDLLNRLNSSQLMISPAKRVAWMRSKWPVHQIWTLHRLPYVPPLMHIAAGDWFIVAERHATGTSAGATDEALWQLLDACDTPMCIDELAAHPSLEAARLGELLQRRWIDISDREYGVV